MTEPKPADEPLARLLQRYPELASVLEGRHGHVLQAELSALFAELFPPRSPRKPVAVIAKLARTVSGCAVEESVIVHDISHSGMRVTLPEHLDLNLSEAMNPVFVLRLNDCLSAGDGPRQVQVRARCVRLLGARELGIELAYTFTEVPDADLYAISQWVKPRGQGSLRPSRRAPEQA